VKITCKVLKTSNGIAWGWADLEDHGFDERSVLEASMRASLSQRIPFCFPLTQDIRKAFGISSSRLGILLGVKDSSIGKSDGPRSFEIDVEEES